MFKENRVINQVQYINDGRSVLINGKQYRAGSAAHKTFAEKAGLPFEPPVIQGTYGKKDPRHPETPNWLNDIVQPGGGIGDRSGITFKDGAVVPIRHDLSRPNIPIAQPDSGTGWPSRDGIFDERMPSTIDDALEGKTYREQAEEQLRGEFKTAFDRAGELGITLPFKTLQEFIDWKQAAPQSDIDYLTKQQDIARQLESAQMRQAFEQMDHAASGMTAMMAQHREGAMAETPLMFAGQFKDQMARQKNQIRLEMQSAQLQREKAMEDLKRAQEAGNIQLAEAIEGQIASIESHIRQIDDQAMRTALMASEEARAIQAQLTANLTTFTNLVNQGTELSTEGIMGFAHSLNIPFEVAYDYYHGAALIREDRSLGIMERELALAQKAQNLQDQVRGVETAAAKNTEYLRSMYARGDSAELINAFKSAAGITDMDDPMYQARLQAQYLSNLVDQKRLSGQPLGFKEMLEWSDAMQRAGGGAVLPADGTRYPGGAYDAIQVGSGIFVDASVPARSGHYQCGAFVNDYFGERLMGDSYADKTKHINSTVPVVGAAFIKPLQNGEYAPYGHTGIVERIDYMNQIIHTVEANAKGDGRISREQYSFAEIEGYYVPANAQIVGQVFDSGLQRFLDIAADPRQGIAEARSTIKEEFTGDAQRQMLEEFNRAIRERQEISASERFGYLMQYFPSGIRELIENIMMEGPSILDQHFSRQAEEDFLSTYLPLPTTEEHRAFRTDIIDALEGKGWTKTKPKSAAERRAVVRELYQDTFGVTLTDGQIDLIIKSL